ncbi:MAG TPA: tripartite tricarboxylate transporter permease, partial [Burkholderiales bacterium]|nr:tripartite tricarboxylate transporter permease [Burkholderiales bacterium]
MEAVLTQLGAGFVSVFTLGNFTALTVGLLVGLLVAVLPGLTLVMGVVLALPFTYTMEITPAVIMLTAMYVSGTYAGAWTAILFRVPGEPIDVPMLWDGYTMARRGEAAQALGWTLLAALFGGLVAATAMVVLSQPIAHIALTFSTPEYFAVLFFGLASVVALGGSTVANALISLLIGLLIATVGVDETYGAHRFTFDVRLLSDGIDYLIVMVGAFGLGEIFSRMEQGFKTAPLESVGAVNTRLPPMAEVLAMKGTFLRGGLLGLGIGTVPGAGATVASFLSYGVEALHGRRKDKMGSGI